MLPVLALFTVIYFVVALPRVAYPFDIDFLEDDVLIEAWRFAQGLPVFAPPNADFVPHVYTPLYMLLAAPMLKLGGLSFLSMRLLSLAATIATGLLLFSAGYQISQQHANALIGPGLFFAGYALTGAQYELARVDSLHLTLAVAGTLIGITRAESRRAVCLAALLLALACFAKQSGIVFALGMAAYLFAVQRQRAVEFSVVCAMATVAPLSVMDRLTNGWSSFYLLQVPGSDPPLASRIISYLQHDLLQALAPLCLLALAAIVLHLRARPLSSASGWLWFILLAIADSGWMRARLGGNINTLMPAYTFLCLAPAIVLSKLGTSSHINKTTRAVMQSLVYLLVIAQCVLCRYNPLTRIPDVAMQQSGQRLIERIRQMPGPVLVLEHPYYALLAHKSPGVSLTALWHARERGALPLPTDLAQRITQQYYAGIIADEGTYSEVEAELDALIGASYTLGVELSAQDAPPTLSGLVVRPAHLFVPR